MTQLAVRLDAAAEQALDRLVARTGRPKSDVVRQAITALDRATLLDQMRAESQIVRTDLDDLAEAEAVLEDVRSRRAW
ncbi:MAG: ribbon-helix-helix domain-containing protein [Micrococcales bacterium]|nr:ribbon-helix-helix domain-containing protein [Micrococcales bacterium]